MENYFEASRTNTRFFISNNQNKQHQAETSKKLRKTQVTP